MTAVRITAKGNRVEPHGNARPSAGCPKNFSRLRRTLFHKDNSLSDSKNEPYFAYVLHHSHERSAFSPIIYAVTLTVSTTEGPFSPRLLQRYIGPGAPHHCCPSPLLLLVYFLTIPVSNLPRVVAFPWILSRSRI